MTDREDKIKIDGVEYALSSLSAEAKTQILILDLLKTK